MVHICVKFDQKKFLWILEDLGKISFRLLYCKVFVEQRTEDSVTLYYFSRYLLTRNVDKNNESLN